MPALMAVRKRFGKEKPFKGLCIGMALHVTKETAALVRTLRDGGAEVAITGCNPLSTQDDVVAALAEEKNVQVFGYRGETLNEYYSFLNRVLATDPQILIDDGADLIGLLLTKHPKKASGVLGACEETTTGVLRLRAMEADKFLKFPVIAVNDNKTKHLMDNVYGTGQSTMDGILRAANILFAGKTVVVCGYGSCGKGVSMRAKGLGANVIVTEVDAFLALQAAMDGYRVMPISEAAPLGDLFITVSGDIHVITLKHMAQMKDGAVLANSGHFDVEIDLKALKRAAKKRTVRPNMDEYLLPGGKSRGSGKLGGGKRIYVLAEGRLVNLAAAEGHPSEVMSLSFCGQALACEYLVQHCGRLRGQASLKNKVYSLPEAIDDAIARMQLAAMGIKIDTLTPEQKKYLSTWRAGT